ncbi:hypothetical protein CBR_g34696 [Chara braunii]|uniref:Uncharacterized protein n=1 Tax=Chara braunii TaxID=69332 RepID=A0A388JYY8_CHABU|nr:hypothetical protein CBR_g34696 [Chara braunii]|eukprot:GBG62996.1 hypothetical protein CBR_g34696 [Chara braunii]
MAAIMGTAVAATAEARSSPVLESFSRSSSCGCGSSSSSSSSSSSLSFPSGEIRLSQIISKKAFTIVSRRHIEGLTKSASAKSCCSCSLHCHGPSLPPAPLSRRVRHQLIEKTLPRATGVNALPRFTTATMTTGRRRSARRLVCAASQGESSEVASADQDRSNAAPVLTRPAAAGDQSSPSSSPPITSTSGESKAPSSSLSSPASSGSNANDKKPTVQDGASANSGSERREQVDKIANAPKVGGAGLAGGESASGKSTAAAVGASMSKIGFSSRTNSRVLQALKQSDKSSGDPSDPASPGSGISQLTFGRPVAPKNIFDVEPSKERIAAASEKKKQPFSVSKGQLFILFSFTLIISIMVGTAYLVWKVGAIHYNT